MKIKNEVLQRMDESPVRKGKWNYTFDEEDIRLHETIFEKICEELYTEGNNWEELSLEKFKKLLMKTGNCMWK